MKLAASLILKGLVGVGAVGGGTVGLVYGYKKGYFSKKEKVENVVLAYEEEKDEVDDKDVVEVDSKKQKTKDELKKEFEDMLKSFSVDASLGIPKKCDEVVKNKKYTTCTLQNEELKKIKFKWLEEGEVNVTPAASVDLKIVGLLGYGGGRKSGLKYLFSNNSSNDIVISNGTKSITLKANSKTGYVVENGKLRKEILGKYGVPKRCERSGNLDFDIFPLGTDKKVCNLYEDDLARIKFSELGDSNEPTVFNWGNDDFERQSVMLTIKEDGKYSFCGNKKKNANSTDINTLTISRGNKSLEIKGEFIEEGNGLKKE